MNNAIVDVRNVSITIETFQGPLRVIRNQDISLQPGEILGIVGESGCGKTTTLRMIAGLETPTSGQIIIDGVTVFDSEKGINISPAKRNVGFLFQNYALWPHMTVYQNIAFGLENLKWKKEQIKERVDELLKMLKIEEFVGRYPSELSGGQQQRVAIARAIVNRPKVLIADEPTGNLDPETSKEIINVLMRINEEQGTTVLVVTHDQKIVQEHKKRTILMEDGCINADTSLGGYDL